jgi:AraC-like DNA-binding protein
MPHRHSVLAAYARGLLRVTERWGVPPDVALEGTGLRRADIEEPGARVPLEPMLALIARARELTGEPGLGIHMALESPISMYGYLGFGMLSGPSLGDVVGLLVEYERVLGTVLTFRLERQDPLASLVVEEGADIGDARDFVLCGVLTGIWQSAQALTGRTPTGTIEVAIAEPPYFRGLARVAPPMRFGRPSTRYVFEAARLDAPVLMADRAAMQLARKECARSLGDLGLTEDTIDRLRRTLAVRDDVHSFSDAAAAVSVSPRTLKRKLAERGVRFSVLLERSARERATNLLGSTSLSIDEIAARLHYASASSFIRAFRRWTGRSPSAYRRGLETASPFETQHRR